MFTINLANGIPSFEEYCNLCLKNKTVGGLRNRLESDIAAYEGKYGMDSQTIWELYQRGSLADTQEHNIWIMKYELLLKITKGCRYG